MKLIDSARAALGAFLALACVADAAAQEPVCQTTVVGRNDPALDVAAFAAAVNSPTASGDVTVCLSGRLDFGTDVPTNGMTVALAPNAAVTALRIVGVTDVNGNRATIRNGTQPIALVRPVAVFSVENMRFVSPAFSAITLLTAGQSVRIAGNQVAGVRTFAPSGQPGLFRNGVTITPVVGPVGSLIGGGDIAIEDNVISGGTYEAADATLTVSAGISLVGALGPNRTNFFSRVTLRDNRLSDWSGSAILVSGLDDATIEGNRIDTGAIANATGGGCAQPNGMGAASGISVAGLANSLIRDNVVNVVPSLTVTGAVPACTAGVIATAIQAAGLTNNIFYRNRVRGGGSHAFVVGATAFAAETDNVFAMNPLANFVPTSAAWLLGPNASDNVVIGDVPTIAGNVAANDIVTQ